MTRLNVYETLSVASIMPPALLTEMVDFLTANRHFILSDGEKQSAFKARFSGHSLLSELVYHIQQRGKDQLYSLVKIPAKNVPLRETMDMTFVPLDMLQVKDVIPTASKALSLFNELDNKLVINISDIAKVNGDFSDVTQFHNRVARDFLSRHFYSSDTNVWLSPTLVRFVAKVYSMTIGGLLARTFNLSTLTQSFVQTVFCSFFVARMTSDYVTPDFMKAHAKNMSLPDPTQIMQIMSFIKDTLGKNAPESIEDVCRVIDAHGHDQLRGPGGSRVSRPILNARFSNLHPERQVAVIALEYPPYFAFMILAVLSGMRSNLSYTMKQMNVMKEGKDVFEQVIKSPLLVGTM